VPQLKEGVIASILSVRDQLVHRDRSHTLLGYDFMVDEDLNVWLIEINSSPAMDYSTHITEKLVQ
jgi:D-alanine-D-alanine ligase-like ATP-grasp enzyme